jgi:predicted nucleotidyltransferase
MRISPDQAQAIVAAARAVAGADAKVSLFGSRLDDGRRGGDIDVLVQLPMPAVRPAWLAAQITARLQRALGDRKVDVLIVAPGMELQPVHRAALRDGVVLS